MLVERWKLADGAVEDGEFLILADLEEMGIVLGVILGGFC